MTVSKSTLVFTYSHWSGFKEPSPGGAAWLTAEEESDSISMKKKTNYIKSTLLSFLKVCLYGYYTNCQFYRISLFHQLNIVFCKISENHFLKDCILNITYLKFIKVDMNFRNSFQIFFFEKILFKIHNILQTYRFK